MTLSTTPPSPMLPDGPPDSPEDLQQRLAQALAENAALRSENIRLERLAYTDALTGLSNPHYWNRWAPAVWNAFQAPLVSNDNDRRRNGALVLAFVDVNGLGKINKDYGDHMGDRLIKEAATSLVDHFKRASDLKHFNSMPDHIIARKGGDELVMLLPQTSVEFLSDAMEKINASSSFEYGSVQVDIRCSYGLAVKSGDKSFEEAILEADIKMQRYKKTAPKSKAIEINKPQMG